MDLKTNGEVSRMRSHKGNMPSLPQTKACALCPAKFTRTTHLNRHMRSHTNERAHRCNTCEAEFTRSDLLTRHKRTCGDSSNTNRSRRKSCQACAESKIKCNLHYPCSKCISRGRECVFINDPETSRTKKMLGSKRKSSISSSTTDVASASTSASASASVTNSPTEYSSPFSPFAPSPPFLSTNTDSLLLAMVPPPLSVSPESSSASSSLSSPNPDFFETQPDMVVGSLEIPFDPTSLDTFLFQGTYSVDHQQYLEPQVIGSCFEIPAATNDLSWFQADELFTSLGDNTNMTTNTNANTSSSSINDHLAYPYPHSQLRGFDEETFTEDFGALTTMENVETLPRTSEAEDQMTTTMMTMAAMNDFPLYDPSSQAPQTSAETDHDLYLNLFFSAFCVQVPLVHTPTWIMDDKPILLIRAMEACGALFDRTEAASTFIDEVLSSTQDTIRMDFAKLSDEPREQNQFLLTVILLQTIGLFHQKAEPEISSNVYHGMLVTMLRRIGVIPRVNAWVPTDMNEPESIEIAWREWAHYETIKRVVFLSYLHDCSLCMYFGFKPSFQPAELDLCLPCDDSLWTAPDSAQWYTASQSSLLGNINGGNVNDDIHRKLKGFPMQMALSALSETRLNLSSRVPLVLNPFSHFILIHTILRNLFAPYSDIIPIGASSDVPIIPDDGISIPNPVLVTDLSSVSPPTERDNPNPLSLQYALHNWLQGWLDSPESISDEINTSIQEEPPFIRNALPFYWLAQVSLLVIQDGHMDMTGFRKKNGTNLEEQEEKEEEVATKGTGGTRRFRILKTWLDRIRSFLRAGNGASVPIHLWDELMKMRNQAVDLGDDDDDDREHGHGLGQGIGEDRERDIGSHRMLELSSNGAG